MKKIIFICGLIFITISISFSLIMATTDSGQRVVLNENGTWQWYMPGPIPSDQKIIGKWNFSWTIGIFTENKTAEIKNENGVLKIFWDGTFGKEVYNVEKLNNNSYQFTGKSFYNGEVVFTAAFENDYKLFGTVAGSGTFAKTGSFSAKKN